MNDVNPSDVQVTHDHMVQCLRDSVNVYLQTQLVHWGLVGSKFYQIHLLTGDILTEMAEGIDDIAEHVRSINYMTPSTVQDLVSSRIKPVDMSDHFDQEKILLDLSFNHDELAGYFEDLAKMCSIIGDELTQDLAADRGRIHKKNQWHLRSTMDFDYTSKTASSN